MAMTASNVRVMRPTTAGAVFMGQSGASLPTAANTALTKFDSLGYVSEDGITLSVSESSENLKDMGGDTVLTIQTEQTVTFTFKPMEINQVTLGAYFGTANVTSDTAATINSKERAAAMWVIDCIGTGKRLMRICIPAGKVTELGDFAIKNNEPFASEITISCFPDASGNKAYIYYANEA